jgi:hypothetical protein
VLDTGEGAASDARDEGENAFATRCNGAEDGEGWDARMRFEDDNGDERASVSDSDDMEATDENGRVEEERGNEHKGNDDGNEAEEL